MADIIILQGITVDKLLTRIEALVERKLAAQRPKEVKESRLLTRTEASELLRVSLPTLSEWTKLGLIKSYRIGRRVLYKSNELEVSLTERKYRRL